MAIRLQAAVLSLCRASLRTSQQRLSVQHCSKSLTPSYLVQNHFSLQAQFSTAQALRPRSSSSTWTSFIHRDTIEPKRCSHSYTQSHHERDVVKIMSYFLAPRLDLTQLMNFPADTVLAFSRPDCVILSLGKQIPSTQTDSPNLPPTGTARVVTAPSSASASQPPFDPYVPLAAVFHFGSVVFFNATEAQQQAFLKHISSVTGKEPRAQSKDDYKIVIEPNNPVWDKASRSQHSSHSHNPHSNNAASTLLPTSSPPFCKFVGDHVLMRWLDLNGIRVFGQVLAQTVALEFYENKVEQMMDSFRKINAKVEASGELTSSSSTVAFKVIASGNTIIADLLTQLRVLDRSEIAWRHNEFDGLWNGLRSEFEVHERFSALDSKIELIRENNKFFSDVLHTKHSYFLEWIIILLISIEILLNLRHIKEEQKEKAEKTLQRNSFEEDWKAFRTTILETLTNKADRKP